MGSVSSEEMDRRTLEMVRAGDHWSLRMSRQMAPLPFTLGWYTFDHEERGEGGAGGKMRSK